MARRTVEYRAFRPKPQSGSWSRLGQNPVDEWSRLKILLQKTSLFFLWKKSLGPLGPNPVSGCVLGALELDLLSRLKVVTWV